MPNMAPINPDAPVGDFLRFRKLATEGGWIIVGQVAAVLSSLVLVRVLTERLSPLVYGELMLAMTIAGLVNQIVMGGLTGGIGRFYSIASEERDVKGYLKGSAQLMVYGTCAVVVIGALLIVTLFCISKAVYVPLVTAIVLFSISSSYNGTLNAIQNAARDRALVAAHSAADGWLKIALAIGTIHWFGSSSVAVAAAYAVTATAVVISQLVFVRRLLTEHSCEPTRSYDHWLSRIWEFSWPFATWGLFTWAQQASDRWALSHFASPSEVGKYAVVFQLGYAPIGMMTGLMMTLLGPIMYQRAGGAKDSGRNLSVHDLAWKSTGISIGLTLIAFASAGALHSWLFKFLVAEPFRAASHYLPWMVLAGGLFAAGQMLSLKLVSDLRPAALTFAKITTAVIGVLTNVMGAYWMGLTGVVASSVAFSVAYLGWMMCLAKRVGGPARSVRV